MRARGWNWVRVILAVALLGSVAGCELAREWFPPDEKAASASAPHPEPTPVPQPQTQTAAAPPPAPPRPPRPAPPELDPRRLVGLDRDETLAMLGQPSSMREQPPSTVWTYKTPSCALDIFFFMDLSTRAFRVLSTELSVDSRAADARRTCLRQLQANSRGH